MAEFLGNMYSWFSFIPRITFTNLVEILILTVLIYEVFLWVQNTRTGVLLKGGLVIIAFYLLAALFHLNTIIWIANNLGQILLLAVIVIFQPELRKALEQLGAKIFSPISCPLTTERRSWPSATRPSTSWCEPPLRWQR